MSEVLAMDKQSKSGTFAAALAAIKRELRKWYGLISVKELISNRDLVLEIEVLERMLATEGV